MKRIFIVAGEPSGDIHGSKLMKAIKDLQPDTEFFGIGGEHMTAEGLDSIISIKEISISGFWEVAKKYSFFINLLAKCKLELISKKVDCFIPIDYPGFNLKLSDFAKSNHIPVIWYIAPQIWAWGKNRGKYLKDKIDKLLVVFPFEKDFFENLDVSTHYVGHPLLDNPAFSVSFPTFEQREKRIAILPGSRAQEIKRHLPLIERTIYLLSEQLPDYSVSIAISPEKFSDNFSYLTKKFKTLELSSDSIKLMQNSTAGIIKTGTSNLEAALCGMPFIMFYKTSGLSYLLSKQLINLPYVSLVNIISCKKVVPELIQNDATPTKIVDGIKNIIKNPKAYIEMQNEFCSIIKLLGEKGASQNAATEVIKFLK